MFATDLIPVHSKSPCLPMGVWICHGEEDGDALMHLLNFFVAHYRWSDEELHNNRKLKFDDSLPLAQDGRRSVCLRKLISSLENFDSEVMHLAHYVYIAFRDEHRTVFYAYLAELERLRKSKIAKPTADWVSQLYSFYELVAVRYFPKLTH